ncbi:hypothetical protein PMAYCL1PPCAC_24660 [Pristionchus mayeri]|uniref:BTB domain-containing protein n=1 Tax=Pristionchus mayeri TaxID=1317129 RepID=A0AAN5I7X6_9BILA|nr:hypothetical protein PMAYCL1PPCAC_24660 [Pristionchus mayeri]
MASENKRARREEEDNLLSGTDSSFSGVIRFEIDIISSFETSRVSPKVEVRGIGWLMKVIKGENANKVCHAGVYLHYWHCGREGSNFWSIDVDSIISVINTDKGERSAKQKLKKTFNYEILNWVYPEFISWEDLINVEKGFVKDDKVTFEARITLSKIIGIRIAPIFDFTDSNEPCHDVALLIQGKKVYASKQILGIHSPVFKALFYQEFTEKNKQEIELKDIKIKEFIQLLNHVYPSGEKITDSSIASLLDLSDRFEIKTVIDRAEQFFIESITYDISSKLKFSDQFRLVRLQDHCLFNLKAVKDIQNFKKTANYNSLSDKAKAMLLEKVMKLNV